MLPHPTCNCKPIHPSFQNEFQFKVIYIQRFHDFIPNIGRFSKVCNEFHVVLDIVLWIGLFVLRLIKKWTGQNYSYIEEVDLLV